MKQKLTLADKLLAKLRKLGMPERKAKDVAKGLAPTAARQTVAGTVTGKLEAKLQKLGLSERKAKELAKGLAPTVRAAIKGKVRKTKTSLDEVTDDDVNLTVDEVTDDAEDVELDKVAPRVNGHRVRLDLSVVPMPGAKAIQLLRVMDGLYTHATYLVAAVKSDEGIVAVRQLSPDYYNVKFYPTMAYWGYTQEQLVKLGAHDYLAREWYQRMHFSREGVSDLLKQIDLDSKPVMTRLLSRLLSVPGRALFKAFDYLHKRVGVAA